MLQVHLQQLVRFFVFPDGDVDIVTGENKHDGYVHTEKEKPDVFFYKLTMCGEIIIEDKRNE